MDRKNCISRYVTAPARNIKKLENILFPQIKRAASYPAALLLFNAIN
jgi:hypothetical protein